ncbi:serine hydrolase domain-containing protein [Paenibacillus sp. B1-33]|uniref:serine hydrolase domain-containing protein n=1 Tax=unclassified Paenibacillus TaxID=185978 RepID=UPI003D2C0517
MNQHSLFSIHIDAAERAGIDPYRLQQALDELIRLFPRMYYFACANQGQLIAEVNTEGTVPGQLYDLRSATKSFISVLVGIAVHRGEMPPLHEPIVDYLPQSIGQRRKQDPDWRRISFKHLLTMTSGLLWETGNRLGERWIRRFHHSSSWLKYALRLPVHPERIGHFQYRSIDSHLLSVLLTSCTGIRADDYAKQHLFAPIGIEHYRWDISPDGHAAGHIGLYLSGRDMLRFGQLILDNRIHKPSNHEGSKGIDRVVPAEWIIESHCPYSSGLPAYGAYGYQWWLHRLGNEDAACAVGHGGQVIYVIPSRSMTVVFAGCPRVCRWRHPRRWMEDTLLSATYS